MVLWDYSCNAGDCYMALSLKCKYLFFFMANFWKDFGYLWLSGFLVALSYILWFLFASVQVLPLLLEMWREFSATLNTMTRANVMKTMAIIHSEPWCYNLTVGPGSDLEKTLVSAINYITMGTDVRTPSMHTNLFGPVSLQHWSKS